MHDVQSLSSGPLKRTLRDLENIPSTAGHPMRAHNNLFTLYTAHNRMCPATIPCIFIIDIFAIEQSPFKEV